MTLKLKDELILLDDAIAELERRRIDIINLLDTNDRPEVSAGGISAPSSKVVRFPGQLSITETTYTSPATFGDTSASRSHLIKRIL